MLQVVAYMLNIVLIATGVFQYIKLELCWAGLGAGIGVANLFVLYFNRTKGALAALAAIGCVIAVAQGTFLGVSAAQTFTDRGTPLKDIGMWDLIDSGHDFSYALAYVGSGLTMLVILARGRDKGTEGQRY